MWIKPNITSSEYQTLKTHCHKLRIKLWTAKNENEASLLGGDYVIYCEFSNFQLFAADNLNDIYSFLRIEVKNE